jgi:N-acetylglucosaminyldiphosphoundecaprenol N-acetyl-beta-D-mannosaminyltransferase
MDIVQEEDLETAIRLMASAKAKQQIVLLSFRDFMLARQSAERRLMLNQAALVLPTSKTLVRGIACLKLGEARRYMPFELVIKVLGVIEKLNGTLYVLGGRTREQNITAGNLRDSFPGLKLIGRYAGYYPKEREEDILTAIKKAAPTLLLTGGGLKGRDLWIYRHKEKLHDGLYCWCAECFDIFCGKKPRLSRTQWERGLDQIPRFFKNPLRFFLIFPRLWYYLVLLVYRIRQKTP